MIITIEKILSFLSAENIAHEFSGDISLEINGFCPISQRKPGHITWIRSIDLFDISIIKPSDNLLIVVDKHPENKFYVTVINGEGSGNYSPGETVTIKAYIPEKRKFDKWGTRDKLTFSNVNNLETTFVMPAQNVAVTAVLMPIK